MNGYSFLVIGTDARLDFLCEELARLGFGAKKYAETEPLKAAVNECDAVILGLPSTRDEKYVNAPALKNKILLKDLFLLMGGKKRLFAGKITPPVKAVADVFGVRWADYAAREEFEILNAVPTAEGALQLAMEETARTVHGANTVLTGYGRIGKILARNLTTLGARVTVFARRSEVRAQAAADNICAKEFEQLPHYLNNADILFNTVPKKIIGREELFLLKNTLVIDLASAPGGVDFDAARETGVRVIWALALPGKVAPVTAAHTICKSVLNILCEAGELKNPPETIYGV